MTRSWLERINGWWAWLIVCSGILLTAALISTGVALHSPRFDTVSVEVAMLFTAGTLFAISALGAFLQAVEW